MTCLRDSFEVLAEAEWTATETEPKPEVAFVPAMERRRLTMLEKAALSVAWKCLEAVGLIDEATGRLRDGETLPVVFASRWGEIGTTLKLMRQQHDEGEMSPAGFSNSVHNAMPGHLSRFLGNRSTYTAVAAGADTYEAGLLEASLYDGKVLFIYAEEETPEYYRPCFPEVRSASAKAMLLGNRVKAGAR